MNVHACITTQSALVQSSIAQKRGVATLFMRPLRVHTIAVQSGVMSGCPERRAQKSTAIAQWSTLSKKHHPTLIAGYGHGLLAVEDGRTFEGGWLQLST